MKAPQVNANVAPYMDGMLTHPPNRLEKLKEYCVSRLLQCNQVAKKSFKAGFIALFYHLRAEKCAVRIWVVIDWLTDPELWSTRIISLTNSLLLIDSQL